MAERAYFPVAMAGVKPPGLDEIAPRVQPERGHSVPASVIFQATEEPGAKSPPASVRNHEDTGDLGDLARQQAQAGAPEYVAILMRHEKQAMGRRQVVAGLIPHSRRDLALSRLTAVIPAGNVIKVSSQHAACLLSSWRHDHDRSFRIPGHRSSIADTQLAADECAQFELV